MYETEVNGRVESTDQLPSAIIEKFSESAKGIIGRTVLPWGEHCTECVWPTCYATCDLYEPREDKKCRRFVDGMVRIPCPTTTNSYLLKIRFKRWAKLWTAGNTHLQNLDEAREIESRDHRVGRLLQILPLPTPVKKAVTWRRYDYKKKWAIGQPATSEQPDAFYLECFNPQNTMIRFTLTMRNFDESIQTPFQCLINIAPGFNRVFVPFHEIATVLDTKSSFHIELTPNETDESITVYFGLLDFIKQYVPQDASNKGKPRTFKCIVWDLDNTIWDGILTEDGLDRLHLKPGILRVLEALDQRGILHSIASKNNHEEALLALKKLGIDEYFLFPQISWRPKSQGMKEIAQKLNLGMDSLAFIDDTDFELTEVRTSCPEARVLNAAEYLSLPDLPECQVPVTVESRNRRKMYKTDEIRKSAVAAFGGDYLAFLRNCKLQMRIASLSPENLERVHELTQRTNQMNFSGNRYERALLEEIMSSDHLDTYVLSCRDRFGDYGIVGFSIVDKRESRMTDLMFSCRIQSKRVEHAFLSYIVQRYVAASNTDFRADYRKTSRNAAAGRVFDDFGMEQIGEKEGILFLRFPKDRKVPKDGIVDIMTHEIDKERETIGSR
jgi:FkbH-like protein